MIDSLAISELSLYNLLGYGVGFLNKTITGLINNKHAYRLEKEKTKQINNGLMFKDVKDARQYRFNFARRTIVLTLFPLYLGALFATSYLGINTVVPIHDTSTWFFGLLHHDTVVLKTVNGFFYDRTSIADLCVMTAGMYMGQNGSL